MMLRRLRNLRADERGAALVELALLSPVFLAGVVGIVDLSNAFSRKLALEQGAQRAIEKIMQTTQDDTVEATLANEAVCQVNGTNADGTCKTSPITSSNVTVTYRLDCTNKTTKAVISTTTTDATVFDAATCAVGLSEARYLEVKVTDKYSPMFPLHFSGINADGTYHISATAGMRTS